MMVQLATVGGPRGRGFGQVHERTRIVALDWRFEPSHLPLTLPSQLVRDFGAIVLVLLGAVNDGRHHRPVRGAIASQLVCDKPSRHATLPLQQFAEEAFEGFPITATLDENIDHFTILINGTPEILALASDRDEDLVQVPRVAEATLPTLQATSVFRPELVAPKSDGFI